MLYTYIQWPESQNYMQEEWFKEEAILDNSDNATSSSYLIPVNRLRERYYTSGEVKNKIESFASSIMHLIAEENEDVFEQSIKNFKERIN